MSLGGSCKALYINFSPKRVALPNYSIETRSLPTLARCKPSTTECYFVQDPIERSDRSPSRQRCS